MSIFGIYIVPIILSVENYIFIFYFILLQEFITLINYVHNYLLPCL